MGLFNSIEVQYLKHCNFNKQRRMDVAWGDSHFRNEWTICALAKRISFFVCLLASLFHFSNGSTLYRAHSYLRLRVETLEKIYSFNLPQIRCSFHAIPFLHMFSLYTGAHPSAFHANFSQHIYASFLMSGCISRVVFHLGCRVENTRTHIF